MGVFFAISGLYRTPAGFLVDPGNVAFSALAVLVVDTTAISKVA